MSCFCAEGKVLFYDFFWILLYLKTCLEKFLIDLVKHNLKVIISKPKVYATENRLSNVILIKMVLRLVVFKKDLSIPLKLFFLKLLCKNIDHIFPFTILLN